MIALETTNPEQIIIFCIFTLGGVGVAIAAHERRIARLEKKHDGLNKAFVPRSEVELALHGIERAVAHLQSMVRALYSVEHKEVAVREIEAGAEPIPEPIPFVRKLEIFVALGLLLLTLCALCGWSVDHEARIRAEAAVEMYQRTPPTVIFVPEPEAAR